MKSTYKKQNRINEKHNNENKNINYKKQKIIKTMSYKINKDSILKETTSSIPTYIELQEESSCIFKLSNPTTPNVIPHKVDEFLKNFRATPQQESGSISSLDQSISSNETQHQRLQQCKKNTTKEPNINNKLNLIRKKFIKTKKVKTKRKVRVNQQLLNTTSQKDKSTKQHTLESHGFKSIIKVKDKNNESINRNYIQTYLPPITELKDNKPQGDIMTR